MPKESAPRPPPTQRDENSGKRENLTDLDTDVEAHDVRDQAIRRQLEFLQLRRQPESVEQAEHEHGGTGIRLNTEEALKPVPIIESLVDERDPDDGVGNVRG